VLFEAEPPAIVGKAAGIDVKIVDISCSITLSILVNSSSKVQSVADLKGKKIALLAGTGVHYGVLKVLENNGLAKSDVEIIDMLPPDAKNAFETGKVDAWAIWSPFIDQEILSNNGRELPNSSFQIQSIMVVRNKFLTEFPSDFLTIKRVFDKAQEWMINNPDEAQQIVAKELDLKIEEVRMAWGRHDWKAEISPEVILDIQNKADFLFSEKFIENKVNVHPDLIGIVPAAK
jgi:sulfonate transport system substrate-binding protein